MIASTEDIDLTGRVVAFVAATLEVDPAEVTLDSTMDSVEGWDSVAILNMAMACEEEFTVQLSAGDIAQLISIKNIVEILQNRGV